VCICTEEFRFTALVFWWGTRKGMRPGTEAVHQIAGMATLELSYDNLEEEGSDF
jgi:cysteine sulfinate desulfinase/cysteine desulfurase-like protein